jgi:hypothetical protein
VGKILKLWRSDSIWIYILSFFALSQHLLVSQRLGYCSDELYFIDCSKNLDFGYFDITPIVPVLIRIVRTVFGNSLMALRLIPALGHATTILLTGLIAKELGGGRFSRTFSSLCVLIAPAFLRVGSVFILASLEAPIWTLVLYLVLLIIKYNRPQFWIWVGLVAGLGFMVKPAILLLTPWRVYFLNRWIWLGGLIALVVMLPNLIWQLNHDWATLEFIQSVKSSSRIQSIDLNQFLFGQVFYLHPINAVVWISGIYYFFRSSAARYQLFGWIYIIVLTVLVSQGSKLYYLLPIYPILLAAGSFQFEKWIQTSKSKGLGTGFIVVFFGAGVLLSPGGLPLFSVDEFDRFANVAAFGLISSKQAPEAFEMYKEMEGLEREKMIQDVAKIYSALPFEERRKTSIIANYYGQAGAINLFGPNYGLPQSISGSVNYYLWGTRGQTAEVAITVGYKLDFLNHVFKEVMAVPENPKIFLCRYPTHALNQIWPQFKVYPNL